MIGFLIRSLFSILATVLSLASVALLAYSLFTVSKEWNKGNKQDLFNLLVISGIFIILVRIIDLIIKKVTFLDYYFRPSLGFVLVFLAIVVPVVIFAVATSSGQKIYEDGYFEKLSDTDFLKAELNAAFGQFSEGFQNVSSKMSKEKTGATNKQTYASGQQAYASGQNVEHGDYNYTGDPGDYMGMLKEDRSIVLFVLLNIITCGLYNFYFIHAASRDANIACAGDGENTSGLLKYVIFTFLTCGIYSLYWAYALANRLAANGPRYGYNIQENGTNYLLWQLLGGWVCGLGFIVADNILIKNLNKVCTGYNQQHPIFQ